MRAYVLFDTFDPIEGWATRAPLPSPPGQLAAHADLAALHHQEELLLAQQTELATQLAMHEDLAAIAHELTEIAAIDAGLDAGATAAWDPNNHSFMSDGGGFTAHNTNMFSGSTFDCYVSPDGDVYINSYDAHADTHTSIYTY